MSSCKSSNSSNKCCGGACLTKNSCNLLTWENPKNSAIVLSSILSSLLLIKYVNLLALFFRLSTFILLFSGLAEYLGKSITGTGLITKIKSSYPKFNNKNFIGDFAEFYAPHAVTILKKFEINIKNLYTSVNIENTIKSGVLSYFIYKITNIFSIWTLCFISTIISFTAPKIYLLNKEIIDKTILDLFELLKVKFNKLSNSINESYGPHIDAAKKKITPIIKLIESKLPIRTAGSTVNEPIIESSSTKSTTTSSNIIDESSNIKKVNQSINETEVDFNALGEQLKQDAINATKEADVFTREKVDAPEKL